MSARLGAAVTWATRTQPRRASITLTAGVVLLVFCASCGDGRRPVFPVRGQVFYQGKPTPEALVIFYPLNDPDPQAPRPIARVSKDGSFSPTTYKTNDGAPAGEYAVTVSWVIERDNQDLPKELQKDPQNLLPDRYSKAETSGLRVEIKKGSNELAPFQLTKK